MVTPGEVITAAIDNGLGWLAWAWDDGGCETNDDWFSMGYSPCGDQSDFSTGLTQFGTDVVLNPTYGLQATAVPATDLSVATITLPDSRDRSRQIRMPSCQPSLTTSILAGSA